MSMRILLSNIILSSRTGTEIFTRDTALGLKHRGHQVSVFTGADGPLADDLRAKGIIVSGDVEAIERPDVIQINHFDHARPLLARFSGVPALSICHDAANENARCEPHPDIRLWAGVSTATRMRVSRETGLGLDDVAMVANSVDLALIPDDFRTAPRLPRRVLLAAEKPFSYRLERWFRPFAMAIGHGLDCVGPFSRHPRMVENFAAEASRYSLVIASARCALEAAAAGAAVLVCDTRGIAGPLTLANWHAWKDHNLGLGTFRTPASPHRMAVALARSLRNPDRAAVCDAVRRERNLETGIRHLEELLAKTAAR